jgi:hypothetical protein
MKKNRRFFLAALLLFILLSQSACMVASDDEHGPYIKLSKRVPLRERQKLPIFSVANWCMENSPFIVFESAGPAAILTVLHLPYVALGGVLDIIISPFKFSYGAVVYGSSEAYPSLPEPLDQELSDSK